MYGLLAPAPEVRRFSRKRVAAALGVLLLLAAAAYYYLTRVAPGHATSRDAAASVTFEPARVQPR